MRKLKERIPLKYIYVLSVCIAILLSVGLYYTYAMFTANVSSGNVVNMDTTLKYNFDISGTQSFHIGKNSIASFYATINNTSNGSIYYEIYYSSNSDLTNVIIGEVVEDKNITTTALNTSGNIDTGVSKDVPLVIANNSDNDIDIIIGVASGYVGNKITYGSNGYPKGTNITSTYNSSDITNSCASKIDTSGTDCTKKIVNGHLITYCPVEDVELQEDPSGANRPVLAEGMIPITYDGTNWVKADEYGNYSDWYDYNNKKWANAVMVTSSKRDTYMNANAGTVVPEADILAYFVWIPRYKYKLFNATYASGTSAQVIDVVFENGTSTTGTVTCTYASNGAESCQNKANGNWYTHPAFTMINSQGNKTELKGIWVGKFETTGSTTSPTIKPGVKSIGGTAFSAMYNAVALFETESYLTEIGVQNTDSHMMKNIEWGSVAYLKQSNYGLGITDMGINNNSNRITGCGAITGSSTSTTCNAYNTATGMLVSTTGNITGVYDMSGGGWDYVMGNYNKQAGSSGLTISSIPIEHIDIYSGTNVSYSHLGDAVGETAGWYSDGADFVDYYNPWFVRGDHYSDASSAGIFSYRNSDASGTSVSIYYAFRTVLSITE